MGPRPDGTVPASNRVRKRVEPALIPVSCDDAARRATPHVAFFVRSTLLTDASPGTEPVYGNAWRLQRASRDAARDEARGRDPRLPRGPRGSMAEARPRVERRGVHAPSRPGLWFSRPDGSGAGVHARADLCGRS